MADAVVYVKGIDAEILDVVDTLSAELTASSHPGGLGLVTGNLSGIEDGCVWLRWRVSADPEGHPGSVGIPLGNMPVITEEAAVRL